MALNKEKLKRVYRKRSRWYDFSANAYYFIGIREYAYRKSAVRKLQLKPGDTVVEIGCGTGLNFDFLEQMVGRQGHIVGVDLTEAMLTKANRRIRQNGWSNVSLVHCDAAEFEFPHPVDGIISTFALTLVPEYDKIIENGARALSSGGRMVILDFKMPEKWPFWLVRLLVMLTRPFGVSLDLADRRLWASVDRHLKTVVFEERYFGGIYICAGEAA